MLKDRDQVVLRTMAETVRPDTELDIADYLSGKVNYNGITKPPYPKNLKSYRH